MYVKCHPRKGQEDPEGE